MEYLEAFGVLDLVVQFGDAVIASVDEKGWVQAAHLLVSVGVVPRPE